ncbi:MAG: hypothetical protein A3G93_13950 [Nitrospinae bacterium RIFCSPLOWO2_12_FULL_45_22]|nr:MAG: hypothetical protein A3G93_13950 [Nitrospinae bacterium RIFCSPLOWO2_12_FULL_45_22]
MAYEVKIDDQIYRVEVEEDAGAYQIKVGDRVYWVDVAQPQPYFYSLIINGHSYEVDISPQNDQRDILVEGKAFHTEVYDETRKPLLSKKKLEFLEGEQKIVSSMPGKVISILAQPGHQVKKGTGVIVIQAMKMENEIKAPKDGEIKEIRVTEGKTIEAGEVLLVIA